MPRPPHVQRARGSGGHHHPGWTVADAVAVLEAPDRRAREDPEVLWRWVRLAEGQTVVEVGAGTGYYSVPAARIVGPGGTVYSVDLSQELVRYLRSRARREGLPQLRPLRSTVASIPLPSGVADVVLMANVLHDVPPSTVREAVRLLRPGGRFLNVDWTRRRSPGGPPMAIRLSPANARRILTAEGLRDEANRRVGPWQYALRLARPAAPLRSDG